jgi:phosphoenolpyruvate---glycerone phosphotransferase subunit DhaL
MKEQISLADWVDLIEKVCIDMEAAGDRLTEIDAKSGDGDLGVSVRLGFAAVRKGLPEFSTVDVGTMLMKSGAVFNAAGASTFGTLMATAFLRAGRTVKGKTEIGLDDIAEMTRSAVEGIRERGQAAPGERTMLDALIPAQEALTAYSQSARRLGDALAAAADAAWKGTAATAGMEARHGRAGWIGKRLVGLPDAGATAIAILLSSLATHANGTRQPTG